MEDIDANDRHYLRLVLVVVTHHSLSATGGSPQLMVAVEEGTNGSPLCL